MKYKENVHFRGDFTPFSRRFHLVQRSSQNINTLNNNKLQNKPVAVLQCCS